MNRTSGAESMSRNDTLHFRGIGVGNRLATAGNPSVVDQYAHGTKLGFHKTDHLGVLFKIVNRCLVGFGAPAKLLYLCDDVGSRRFIAPVIDRDIGTVLCQREGNSRADAAPRTGNQRHPTF